MTMSQRRATVDWTRKYSYTASMKTSLEIPDALYRRVKARSALEGKSVRDVTIGLFEGWLAEPRTGASVIDEADRPAAAAAWLRRWGELGESVAASATDARTTREILEADRR